MSGNEYRFLRDLFYYSSGGSGFFTGFVDRHTHYGRFSLSIYSGSGVSHQFPSHEKNQRNQLPALNSYDDNSFNTDDAMNHRGSFAIKSDRLKKNTF